LGPPETHSKVKVKIGVLLIMLGLQNLEKLAGWQFVLLVCAFVNGYFYLYLKFSNLIHKGTSPTETARNMATLMQFNVCQSEVLFNRSFPKLGFSAIF